MKRTKEQEQKRLEAREEARPHAVMEIAGWKVSADARQFIIRQENKSYYFSNLENALWDISERLTRSKVKGDLESAVSEIREIKKDFLQELKLILKK